MTRQEVIFVGERAVLERIAQREGESDAKRRSVAEMLAKDFEAERHIAVTGITVEPVQPVDAFIDYSLQQVALVAHYAVAQEQGIELPLAA